MIFRAIKLSKKAQKKRVKTINRLILNSIQSVLEPRLRPNQNDFRPARSTNAQILALRRTIDGVKSNNLKVVCITSYHLKKALTEARC